MGWSQAAAQADNARWLANVPGDSPAFPYGVAVFEAFLDTEKLKWCQASMLAVRLQYDPRAPAHHVYRFGNEFGARRFARQWMGARFLGDVCARSALPEV